MCVISCNDCWRRNFDFCFFDLSNLSTSEMGSVAVKVLNNVTGLLSNHWTAKTLMPSTSTILQWKLPRGDFFKSSSLNCNPLALHSLKVPILHIFLFASCTCSSTELNQLSKYTLWFLPDGIYSASLVTTWPDFTKWFCWFYHFAASQFVDRRTPVCVWDPVAPRVKKPWNPTFAVFFGLYCRNDDFFSLYPIICSSMLRFSST